MFVIAKVKELKKSMVMNGLTMRDLANLAEIGSATVFNVCNGKKCSARVSNKICKALKVEFDEIFEMVEKN